MEGIPTVAVYVKSFRHVAENMGVPRAVVTRHPMGRPVGPACDVERQQAVIDAALDLLENAAAGGAIDEIEAPFRPGRL